MFPLPIPVLAIVAVAIALAVAWWWSSRVQVSEAPPPVPMMATRIAFPRGLRLDDPAAALALLDRPYEIVIPFEHAVLEISYPLTTPASIPITASISHGFTRAELVQTICDEYAHVYEAEEGTAGTKPVPTDERGIWPDRNPTDGAYGIWGHDLKDLVLTSARWVRHSDGTVKIELHVETAPTAAPDPTPAPAA